MTTTVRQILAGRTGVYMVSPDDTIFDALRLMADKNIGAVLVMSDGAIAGIVSERDYARKVVLLGRTSKTTPVREIMTTDVISVEPGWTADQCMALMTERRIRHLPVVENGTARRHHLDRRRRPRRRRQPAVRDQVARELHHELTRMVPSERTRAQWSRGARVSGRPFRSARYLIPRSCPRGPRGRTRSTVVPPPGAPSPRRPRRCGPSRARW